MSKSKVAQMKQILSLLILTIAFTSKSQSTTTVDSLDIMIGQMVMIGIGDISKAGSDSPIFDEIKDGKVGGVVLYEKNISKENSSEDLKKLALKLQKISKIPLFISIDEEGGKVTRLKKKIWVPEKCFGFIFRTAG
jgi:beta-N-acetylhexosaminidase